MMTGGCGILAWQSGCPLQDGGWGLTMGGRGMFSPGQFGCSLQEGG